MLTVALCGQIFDHFSLFDTYPYIQRNCKNFFNCAGPHRFHCVHTHISTELDIPFFPAWISWCHSVQRIHARPLFGSTHSCSALILFNPFMLGPYSVQRIHARPLFIGSTFPPYCFICSYFIALAKFGRLEHKTIVITKMASYGRSMNDDFVCYLGHNWLGIRSREVSLC